MSNKVMSLIIPAAIVLSVFTLFTTSVSAADLVWNISTVDANQIGQWNSLALDAASNPHISPTAVLGLSNMRGMMERGLAIFEGAWSPG